MREKDQGLPIDGRALDAAPHTGCQTASGSSSSSLTLAPPLTDHVCRTGEDTLDERRQPAAAAELAARWERRRGTLIMWLSGALDRATATLLDRELDARATGTVRLIVDLTGLEFIDSPGLDALVRIHWRAAKRGDTLSFRHGPRVAQRPIELTQTVRRRSRYATRPADADDQDFYIALAIACADVDHPRPGDRPGAA
jgi:anti-anti-sigma factor